MSGCSFTVPRRKLYEAMADRPGVRSLNAWAERYLRKQRENHDPGDEDRT